MATNYGKGRADFLSLGDWNAVCYQCGRKRKASTLKRNWQGFWVCPEHWETRQPQDFVRGIQDIQTPPWTQPMPADTFIGLTCTPATSQSFAGTLLVGCWRAGYTGDGIPPYYPPSSCTVATSTQAGFITVGCWSTP